MCKKILYFDIMRLIIKCRFILKLVRTIVWANSALIQRK